MAYSLLLTAFQGDFAGATVDRQPNEIYLSACYTEWGSPVSPLHPVEISVGPLTPGAAANGVVLGVLPGPVPGSYRIAVGQWDDGSPAWKNGVHVFAVQVRASVSWPFGTGSTLAGAGEWGPSFRSVPPPSGSSAATGRRSESAGGIS
jgi:hypothetical protein